MAKNFNKKYTKNNYCIKYLPEGFQLPKIDLPEGWVSRWCQNYLTPEQLVNIYSKEHSK